LIGGVPLHATNPPLHATTRAAGLGGGAVDAGCVEVFLAAALSRVMRAAVPIPAVAAASVLLLVDLS